jgi:hypothetical protein
VTVDSDMGFKRSDTVLTELELQHDCTGPAEAILENAPFISC